MQHHGSRSGGHLATGDNILAYNLLRHLPRCANHATLLGNHTHCSLCHTRTNALTCNLLYHLAGSPQHAALLRHSAHRSLRNARTNALACNLL
ncbi:hypothetical protein, partial [Stenotrophomonas sp.]|uniref:hypothetical protein n=1 Tax=Stenotrophomonas sp. TaxID=69392 RepID=UPI0028AEAFB7